MEAQGRKGSQARTGGLKKRTVKEMNLKLI